MEEGRGNSFEGLEASKTRFELPCPYSELKYTSQEEIGHRETQIKLKIKSKICEICVYLCS